MLSKLGLEIGNLHRLTVGIARATPAALNRLASAGVPAGGFSAAALLKPKIAAVM